MNSLISWSGGKDSCYAAIKAVEQGSKPQVLLNVLNENGKISRSHGIPLSILRAQAAAMGLPLHTIASSWADYEKHFTEALAALKAQYNLTHAVYGDIDLQPHREWEEKVSTNAGLEASLPLWQQNRRQLLTDMLEAGIETMIVSCNSTMGESYLGRILTLDMIPGLEALGVDVCGENGEFHTLVLNCSLFASPIAVAVKNKLIHKDYCFCELELLS